MCVYNSKHRSSFGINIQYLNQRKRLNFISLNVYTRFIQWLKLNDVALRDEPCDIPYYYYAMISKWSLFIREQ